MLLAQRARQGARFLSFRTVVRDIHVSVRPTPNPAAMVFAPASGRILLSDTQPLVFRQDESGQSNRDTPSVVAKLLSVPGVREVMLTPAQVTVNLDDSDAWDRASPLISEAISSAVLAHPVLQLRTLF